MINLRLATADSRRTLIISEDDTPMAILESNDIVLDGASINLDGIPLTREEMHTPFGDLVYSDTATLSVVVKTGNA